MLTTALLLARLASPAFADDNAPVLAQDEDIPSDDSGSEVKREQDEMKEGKTDDEPSLIQGKIKRNPIKIITDKTFMKIGRFEAGPSIGFVTNDPFLRRRIVGGVFDYHLTEIFALELQLNYAPDLGQGATGSEDADWKPLSKQLLDKNNVSPDISKLTGHGSLSMAYSPIYGKAAIGDNLINFDVYGTFGLGITQTADDLEALQAEGEPTAIATENQVHPTTVIGGGLRVAFNENLAWRVEAKSMSYIETVNSDTLEMKNNFILQTNVSFFFPNMKK